MSRFHYSKAVGEARRCSAEVGNCPLAPLSEHFQTYKEASLYAEERNTETNGGSFSGATHTKEELSESGDVIDDPNLELKDLEIREADFSTMTLEEKKDHQHSILTVAMKRGESLTGRLQEQHKKFVSEVVNQEMASGRTTSIVHAKKRNGRILKDAKGRTVYTESRRKDQEEVLKRFKDKYKDTPSEKKALVSGGIGGAGKGSTLRLRKEIDPDNPEEYAVANPDDIKEEMAELGMIPHIKGTTPMDLNTLVHEEASMLTKELQRELIEQDKNVVFDRTIAKTGNIMSELDDVKERGYKVEGVFVDVTKDVSEKRADSRYLQILDQYLVSNGESGNGGRFLPDFVNSDKVATSGHSTVNAENFQQLAEDGYFDNASYFDNNVNGRDPEEISEEDFQLRGKRRIASSERSASKLPDL